MVSKRFQRLSVCFGALPHRAAVEAETLQRLLSRCLRLGDASGSISFKGVSISADESRRNKSLAKTLVELSPLKTRKGYSLVYLEPGMQQAGVLHDCWMISALGFSLQRHPNQFSVQSRFANFGVPSMPSDLIPGIFCRRY